MINLRKLVLVFVFLLILSVFTACKGKVSQTDLEAVLPENMDIIAAIDYSNSDQVKQFEKLLKRFPELGLKQKFVEMLDQMAQPDSETRIDYQADIKPIFQGDWKILFGIVMTEDADLSATESTTDDAVGFSWDAALNEESIGEVYVVGQFENIEAMEKLLNKEAGVTMTEEAGIKYWNTEESSVAIFEDLIVISPSQELARAAIERFKNGAKSSLEIPKDSLGYVYLSADMVEQSYGFSMSEVAEEMQLSDMILSVKAEDKGFRAISSMKIDQASVEKVYPGVLNEEDSMVMADKINSEGLLFYYGGSGFGTYMNTIWKSMVAGYTQTLEDAYAQYPENEQLLRRQLEDENPLNDVFVDDAYENFLAKLAESAQLEPQEMDEIINSPFAMTASDTGGMVPNFAFYLQLDEELASKATNITSGMESYVDKMVTALDSLLASSGEQTGFLKKDVEVVQGGGLHKLYIDWEAASEELKSGAAFLPGAKDVEFYYGVTGDNILALAFYPGFTEAHGENVLNKNKEFKEAAKLVDEAGAVDSYMNVRGFMDFVNKYWGLAQLAIAGAGIQDAELQMMDTVLTKFIPTFKYIVSAAKYEDGVLRSEAFLVIEEVKEEKGSKEKADK